MIEALQQWGCDTEDAMNRMLNDEAFYRECLMDILNDPCFEQLGSALSEHCVQKAFELAHTLKGVLANLGLTPMYRTTVALVEPLRAGHEEQLLPYYEELMQEKTHLAEILQCK